MSLTRAFHLIAVLAAAGGLAAAPAVAGAHAATKHHHKHHRNRIPQHNGGDHDADNRSGPSDGDGNV
jgi:hypothetical protein